MDAELRGLGLDDRHGELTEDRGLLEPPADRLAVRSALGLNAPDADEVAPCRSEKHEAPVLTALHRDEVDATTSLVPRHGLSGERVEFPLVAQIRTQALGATLGGLTGHLAKRLVGLLLLAGKVRHPHERVVIRGRAHVEDQAVVLVGMEAEPAADGLDIEALRLRRAGHEHTVHSGGVEACGEHLDRSEYADFSGLEGVVELPALAGRC